MTVKRTYQCDLCSYIITPSGGLGISWVTGAMGERLDYTSLTASEHHLCHKCIVQLTELFTRNAKQVVKPDDPGRLVPHHGSGP